MEELLEKIALLKTELNETEQVKNIKRLNTEIKKDKELLNNIELYKQTRKDSLKQDIYDSDLYQEYKHAETELNILILFINSKLTKISNKGKCKIWK